MKILIPILLIILIAINVFFIGRIIGILSHPPQSCAGYSKILNELQVEKEQLIIKVNEKQDTIDNMARECR